MNYTSSQVVQHTTTFKACLDVYNKTFADNLFTWHKFNFNSPRRSSLIALCKPLETFPWNISIISSVESSIFAIYERVILFFGPLKNSNVRALPPGGGGGTPI